MEKISTRDKAILIGLYLSKFDNEGLELLGFDGFTQAFNTIGYALGVKPASIKNYRDEFDPYFPNKRKGWHNRSIRIYCKNIFDNFSDLKILSFAELIKSFLIKNYDVEQLIAKVEKRDKSESVAKRLITGKAAEEYFKLNYSRINHFSDYNIQDTTNLGCGFDFKLFSETNYYCVEVKGLNLSSGSILLTEKEFLMANELKSKFCLFIVMNFIEKPEHQYFFDPLNSSLQFRKAVRKVVQINYLTSI